MKVVNPLSPWILRLSDVPSRQCFNVVATSTTHALREGIPRDDGFRGLGAVSQVLAEIIFRPWHSGCSTRNPDESAQPDLHPLGLP
jgi:hypothetical protein